MQLTANGDRPDPDRTPQYDAADMALRRAQRFVRRLKHQPFIALVIDEGRDRVQLYHTTGINREQLDAIRLHLDEIERDLR